MHSTPLSEYLKGTSLHFLLALRFLLPLSEYLISSSLQFLLPLSLSKVILILTATKMSPNHLTD